MTSYHFQGTVADSAPVVPISAQLKYNIDVVCEYIVKKIPIPERNFTSPPNMIVIRSFDVNKPGFEVDEICGGVAGGSILKVLLSFNCVIYLFSSCSYRFSNFHITINRILLLSFELSCTVTLYENKDLTLS